MTDNLGRKFSFGEGVRIIARAFRVVRKVMPGYLSLTSVSKMMSSARPLVALYMSARVLNELSEARDIRAIVAYVIVTVVAEFALSAAGAFLEQRVNTMSDFTYPNLEYLYAKKYMSAVYPNVEDSSVNQFIADIRARTNGNGLGLWHLIYNLPDYVGNLFTFVVSIVMLAGMFAIANEYTKNFITSPAATAALVVLAAISFVSPLFIIKLDMAANERMHRENPKANTLFMFYFEYKDVRNAAKDIRLYNQADTLTEIFLRRLNNKFMKWFFTRLAATNSLSGAIDAFVGGAVYMFIGLRALYGMYSVGSLVMYVGAVTNFIKTMSALSSEAGQLINNLPYMQNIYDYLDMDEPESGGLRPDGERIELEFENVSFKYPNGMGEQGGIGEDDSGMADASDGCALRGVSLKFEPGKRLAVVGMNGSGKTTMVKLLCRLYKPDEGVIKLNGVNIDEYDLDEYIKLFNVVFQDYKLFSLELGSVVANSNEYGVDKVRDALYKANFGERIESLSDGLSTMIGKNCDKDGVIFSGGEQQKIAIARAIYRDSGFVVFDEPTAALDPISEYEVYTKLNEIIGGKTAVFISHRLSSCKFCDEIAVFHDGRVIQRGTHDKLLEDENGKYFEMWTAQARHYNEPTGFD